MKILYFPRLQFLANFSSVHEPKLAAFIGSRDRYSDMVCEFYFTVTPEYRSILFESLRQQLNGRNWSFHHHNESWGSIQIPLFGGENRDQALEILENHFKNAFRRTATILGEAWGKDFEIEKWVSSEENSVLAPSHQI